MQGTHIHHVDPPYAPPVLRAPSPSSSIGTDYGPDETTPEEEAMSDDEFARSCEERLRLHQPSEGEIKANQDPLLPKPRTKQEEDELFQTVMKNLREAVQRLREDELFQHIALRGSIIAEEQQPSSNDIDTIMRSMMNVPTATTTSQPVVFPPVQPAMITPTEGHGLYDPDFNVSETSITTNASPTKRVSSRNKGKTKGNTRKT